MRDMDGEVRNALCYMTYAPIVFISALTGSRVDKLFSVIQEVHTQNTSRITTGALNSILADATARVQPPSDKGRRLKIYYMTQAGIKPPICLRHSATMPGCSTSPINAIWKIRSARYSVWREPRYGLPFGRRARRRIKIWKTPFLF